MSSASLSCPVLKVILLGDSSVGKSSLLNRFVNDAYDSQYKATIGSDMRSKEVLINGERVNLQIWDTAGQERFNSLSRQFHRGSNLCLLVFDLTDSRSFESLAHWRDQFLASVSLSKAEEEAFPFACLGNKLDLQDSRAVSQRRAVAWCNHVNSIPYYETSAKESTNVTLAFMEQARKALALSKQLNAQIQKSLYTSQSPNVIVPTAKPIETQQAPDAKCCQ
jgi:Ras-related protein Rab-7A